MYTEWKALLLRAWEAESMKDKRIIKAETIKDENDRKYWHLFHSIDEGFCIIEIIYDSQNNPVDFLFLEVNPAFARQTGLQQAEGNLMSTLVPEHEDDWYQIFGRIAMTGKPERFEHEAKALNRWYDVYAFCVGVPESRQLAIIFNDITERKNTEIELRRRTIELEANNQEWESFSNALSHDLRAPLRSLDGFSLALIEDYGDKLDFKAKEYLQYIRTSSQHMGQMIDDMLNLSRINRIEIHLETVDLSVLAYDVVNELQLHQPERKIEFIVASDLEVIGDKNLLKLVLHNLLGNACKYTGNQNQAVIEFGKARYCDEDVYFVRDNGIGIDLADHDQSFKPSYKFHHSSEFPGSGIGLAAVQRIVNRLGGRVWAEGNPGQGATFCFTLSNKKT
jgi:PAS domain S-box-containing protein